MTSLTIFINMNIPDITIDATTLAFMITQIIIKTRFDTYDNPSNLQNHVNARKAIVKPTLNTKHPMINFYQHQFMVDNLKVSFCS